MNKIIQKLGAAWKVAKPYVKAFFAFIWAHKVYSLVTFALGALAGIIFF